MILSHRTLVLTNNGIKRVECLSPSDLIFTGDGYSTFSFQNIDDQDVTEITTERGYSICGDFVLDISHDFKINEINIKKVSDEDFAIVYFKNEYSKLDITTNLEAPITPEKYKTNLVYKRYKNIKFPTKIDNDLAYLLGYSYGDGYTDRKTAFEVACADSWPEITNKLFEIFPRIFSFTPRLCQGDGALHKIRFNDKTFIDFLRMNEILKQKAGNLILPDFIFNNYSLFVSFYSGIFDADGYASGKKKGYNLTLIDRNVMKELQIILSLCGIISRIHVEDRTKQGWQTMYPLSICGTHSQKNLVSGFSESVKIKKSSFISLRDSALSPYNAKTFNVSFNKHYYCPDNREYLSINCINRLNADNPEYNIPNNLFRSKITKINKTKTNTIKIAGVQSIWANGFIISSSTGDSKCQ